MDEFLDGHGDGDVNGDQGIVGGVLDVSRTEGFVLPGLTPNSPVLVELNAKKGRREAFEPELLSPTFRK